MSLWYVVAGMYRDILIATDGSELGQRAADHGLGLARSLNATVHGLAVLSEGVTTRDRIRADPEGEAEATLKEMKETGDTEGVAVTTEIRSGDPCDTIVEYAQERDVDLIIMGTTTGGRLDRLFHGSTTQCVSKKSAAPVLSVGETTQPVFAGPADATYQFYCSQCDSSLKITTETKEALEEKGCILCGGPAASDAFSKLEVNK